MRISSQELEGVNILILGCGRVGARLARLLEEEGHPVTVIDQNRNAFTRLENFKGSRILGNGIDVDVLKKAGIEKANAFAAVTNGDNTNLMTAQIAQKLFHVPKVVCRVYDPKRSEIYHDLGIATVCSTTVGARMIRNILTGPMFLRSYHLADAGAAAVEFKIGPKALGKTVGELEIPKQFSIGAVIRKGSAIIPDKTEKLQEEDQIFGVVMTANLEQIKALLDASNLAVNFV